MRTIIRLFIALVICLSMKTIAFAGWEITSRVDPMTDETKTEAYIENDTGFRFSVYRLSPGGPVWCNFRIPDENLDTIDGERLIIYRIDKNKPDDLSKYKDLQRISKKNIFYDWEPTWVNFKVWHGDENEGIGKILIDLMKGSLLLVRYYVSTGGYKDTFFQLDGATDAICKAIGIDKNIDFEKQNKIDEFKREFIKAGRRCRDYESKYKKCIDKIVECKKIADGDIDKFKSCFDW